MVAATPHCRKLSTFVGPMRRRSELLQPTGSESSFLCGSTGKFLRFSTHVQRSATKKRPARLEVLLLAVEQGVLHEEGPSPQQISNQCRRRMHMDLDILQAANVVPTKYRKSLWGWLLKFIQTTKQLNHPSTLFWRQRQQFNMTFSSPKKALRRSPNEACPFQNHAARLFLGD